MHRLIYLLLFVFFTSYANAAEVENLYQSKISVKSRDSAERDQVLPILLQHVLRKIVGDETELSATDIPVVDDFAPYVQQYHYELINTVGRDLTEPDQLALVVNFNENSIDKLIKQIGLPIWGKVRPDVIVWLAYRTEQASQVLGLENAPSEFLQPLIETAELRGIPVILPLMDLQDQTQIHYEDVSQFNEIAVLPASRRYGSDIALTANIQEQNGQANIQWQTKFNSVPIQWYTSGSLQQAMADGINELTNRLARDYNQVVVATTSDQHLKLSISDVMNFADYTRLMDYLGRIETITNVDVENLGTDSLDISISFKGSKEILKRTLVLGQVLLSQNNVADSSVDYYRLSP